MGRTLFDKIWDDHVIAPLDDNIYLLHIDRVLLHERSGSIALSSLRGNGRRVRNPAHVFATMDHIVDTHPGRGDDTPVPGGSEFI
ncbi:MAG: aconitase family protein, partial [Gammaproteobacteria bacterium]